ncbi:hypothetical protein C5167_001158 [Papaver somniferum]|uniref:BolA protein n=1 Tax=Papaver somniferum TaxID=3469 RepID=A0A4Y7KW50_PAPSO|nr:hypothetical protein C5167_001158 [Papaver somniferum]
MSISSSVRLLPPKIPLFLQQKFPILKTLRVQSPKFPTNLSLYSSISIQKLPTKLSSSPSSNNSTSLQPIEELPQNLQDIIKLFQTVEEPKKRNNGFLNMLRLMQNKALQLYIESQKQESSSSVNSAELGTEDQIENIEIEGEELKTEEVGSKDEANGGLGLKSRGERIKEKLEKELAAVELEIEDISYQHTGHAGEFDGKSLVKRHRLIYDLLQEELDSGLHALSIVAKAPAEVNGK